MNWPAISPATRLRPRAPILAVLCGAAAAGCVSYPERTAEALHAFQSGQLDEAIASYEDAETTGTPFLTGAEAGTVALAAGRWEDALAHFEIAAAAVHEVEERALVSAEASGEWLASLALNDTMLEYPGEGFERVYLHCGMALAYLAQGRVEDVRVETRRANQLLEREEELYEKEYRAGGLGHLLSALAYELEDDLDDARIDYERMVAKGVGEGIAGKALVRVTKAMGWDEDHERWVERFGPDAERPADAASIVVLGGLGLGPFKTEARIALPTPAGLFAMTAPQYSERPPDVTGLRLASVDASGAEITVLTDVIESVAEVARVNLEDRLALIAFKSAARGVGKVVLTKQLEDQHGGWGRVAGDVFALATERADLRCWLTLPSAWHAARLFVVPGEHRLRLDAIGGGSVDLGQFALEPGETMFVIVRTVDGHLWAHPVGGRLVEASQDALEPDAGETLDQLDGLGEPAQAPDAAAGDADDAEAKP